jgi:hypothetical protein
VVALSDVYLAEGHISRDAGPGKTQRWPMKVGGWAGVDWNRMGKLWSERKVRGGPWVEVAAESEENVVSSKRSDRLS